MCSRAPSETKSHYHSPYSPYRINVNFRESQANAHSSLRGEGDRQRDDGVEGQAETQAPSQGSLELLN